MAAKKRGLGRGLNDLGLNELLSDINTPQPSPAQGELRRLPVDFLQPGKYQPRRDIDYEALEELATSVRSQGILQPLVVRRLEQQGRYEIIAGERRWRAAQLAELSEVPVIVRDISDQAAMAIGLIENIQREDLNALEQATAFHRLMENFQMTHEQVAEAVGKNRATVSNLMRLLNLTDEVKTLLQNGDLEMGHGRALLALSESQQLHAAQVIIEKGLSVREAEHLIRRLQSESATSETKPAKQMPADILQWQQTLADKLKAKVKIQHQASGKGKLVIPYRDAEHLKEILDGMV